MKTQSHWQSDLTEEAVRRTSVDGIPRYVTNDGRIMKYDWELPEGVPDWTQEELEQHIANLIAQQT